MEVLSEYREPRRADRLLCELLRDCVPVSVEEVRYRLRKEAGRELVVPLPAVPNSAVNCVVIWAPIGLGGRLDVNASMGIYPVKSIYIYLHHIDHSLW